MGYVIHHSILVTTFSDQDAIKAKAVATGFNLTVTGPYVSEHNSYHTIIVLPDGSKEGWPQSDIGDARRAMFVDWLRNAQYSDGSNSYSWVEVAYGETQNSGRDVPELVSYHWDENHIKGEDEE